MFLAERQQGKFPIPFDIREISCASEDLYLGLAKAQRLCTSALICKVSSIDL